MSDLNSVEYYRKRQQRESELSAAAKSPAIASIHREMAVRYSTLVRELSHQAQREQFSGSCREQ